METKKRTTTTEKELAVQGIFLSAVAALLVSAFASGCSFQVATEYWGKTGIDHRNASAFAHDGDDAAVKRAKY